MSPSDLLFPPPVGAEPTPRDRVLVVDDEPEILVALTDLLEDDCDIVTAGSGQDALAIIRERNDFTVIVSDQRMRDMTGDVFLAEARTLSDAGTILLTGYADLETVVSALNRGAITFYAAKPWEPDALRAMVREAAAACRTRRALATERSILRSLFDSLPVGIGLTDTEGRFTRLNALAAQSFGRTEVECLGQRESDLVAADVDIAPERARLGAHGAESGARNPELVARTGPGGLERWHRVTRVALPQRRDESASERAFPDQGVSVLIDQDVTDLIAMEKQLRQADKMQAIGTLAGGIAHDFNNLLTAILGSLELVSDLAPPAEPRVARLFDNAIDAARRGATLTQKLLDFSRPRDLARRSVDVPQLLGQMRGLLTQSIGGGGKRSVAVRLLPTAPDLPPASTDPSLLEVALVNLCLNARDAQPNGGEIVISAKLACVGMVDQDRFEHSERFSESPLMQSGHPLAPGRYVVVTVADHGVGMSPETQARIFEPFFTTKAVGGGIGLGLPMIYGFMRRNEGDVRVTSAPGSGTSIELWLPAADVSSSGVRGSGEAVHSAVPRTGGRSVLVVDDDESVATVTAQFLARAGFNVLECHSGAEAIALVQTRPDIGLIIMDLLMPQMNGDECARRIAAIRTDLRVLFVTGFADRATLPPDARVIAKPFTRDVLLSGIEAVLAG